jgi:hypothetical protein
VTPVQGVGAVILLAAVIQLQLLRSRSTDVVVELPDLDRRPALTRT